ncbi:MAG TPA: diaminopimelate epimerase [Candidatus Binataceae bacterium]|jgi:diaminopimelate epimerase|nr:diaminopimelate epimerase [Candidatus Binataceae bacterium]
MAKLSFTKMHGCGNDYIYVIADRVRPANPGELSRRLSDRRFGIGGDGLILLAPSKGADVRMEMYNADGSRGEMCGNGIRCVARLHYERAAHPRNPMVIETDCGFKSVALKIDGGRVSEATVDMGEPILEGREIPAAADGRVIDHPLEVGGRIWRVTAVSMGNPHCVVFVDDEAVFALEDSEFARVGRQFEHHPFFPRRVNTEFILALGRDRLRMRVWERGSGETLACGTGACAALVAAVLTGRAERRAMLELRGGKLGIEWRERGETANHVMMTGDAVEVFSGEVEVGDGELVPVVP